MSFGVRCWDAAGNLTFDSYLEFTVFPILDVDIPWASVGSGLSYSFPNYVGLKIGAILQSPTNESRGIQPWDLSVLACRITYPGGVPTVTVIKSDASRTFTANGHLSVTLTGATQ